jgi:hypothetical protein
MALNTNNRLPDPDWGIDQSGAGGAAYTKGPGFASVNVSSKQPVMRDRTNSGRLISRVQMYHQWMIDISYNPMTEAQFDPIYSFLLRKQAEASAFYVVLPQDKLTSGNFHGLLDTGTMRATANTSAGARTLTLDDSDEDFDANNLPPAGTYFNIPSIDFKTYMITAAELNGTNADISFIPALNKNITTTDDFEFLTVKFRVVQVGDTSQYSLGTTGLYQFSLKLEEAL